MKCKHYTVLYDGYCLFCGRARKLILLLDWCKLITHVNIYDKEALVSTNLSLPSAESLAANVHLIDTNGRVYQGFYACRKIGTLLPLLFLPSLVLYLPGVSWLGVQIYSYIATHRK